MKVALRHTSGVTKRVKVGFSWTMFFFGWLVPLIRGDIKGWFKIWLLGIVTLSLYYWIAIFTYNNNYIKQLLTEGYTAADESSLIKLQQKGIIA
ncbi:hypothetical protein [Paenibacillus glycanilyticus]|uniref:hypothetical protein n=1 Tax=Paenibacillus glycanilyticus TaxID=126569 RepID=UPI003EB7B0EE